MRLSLALGAALAVGLPAALPGQEKSAGPKPVPVTRQEMKQALEALKTATPRLPLPPPSAEEKARAGGRPVVNNGRMRQLYLPAELRGGDFSRDPDPGMSLDYKFKTMLFWIVSRVNNCHY
jgi:hypothetical protein